MACYDGSGASKWAKRRRVWLCLIGLYLLLVACGEQPADNETAPEVPAQSALASATGESDATHSPVVTATPDARGAGGNVQVYEYTDVSEEGPTVLDPALAHDAPSRTVVRNVMETLVYPDPSQGGAYVPLLATGWRISDEGHTVTFSIRRGVQFSNGNVLTPGDVAYSLQRLLVVSAASHPQKVLLDPLLGPQLTGTIPSAPQIMTGTIDSTAALATHQLAAMDIASVFDGGAYVGDRAALAANVPPSDLEERCQNLRAAITANDSDGTVTLHLAQPWGPLLDAMSQTWASIVDQQWAVERGAWDGSCQSWHEWYALENEESALGTAILGTGPYVLDAWAPGVEYVLRANPGYWRGDDAMWVGGPSGAPAISHIRVQQRNDPNERWQMLESGEALVATLSQAGQLQAESRTGEVCDWLNHTCEETEQAEAPLRRVEHLPVWTRHALFFNFDIVPGDGGYLGSGQLDGEGIPPGFFADVNVRRAFAYCLDARSFVDAGLDGAGYLSQGLIPAFVDSQAPQDEVYPYRLQLCSEALSQAWDGVLPSIGFRLRLPFESGNVAQQATALLLQTNLRAVNPRYRIDVTGLPAPLLQQEVRERRAPLALVSWQPQMPGPFHWIAPAFGSGILAFQQPPAHLQIGAVALLERLRRASDPLARSLAVDALHSFYIETLPFIQLPQPATTMFQQRSLESWFYHAADPLPYYYAYRLR